MPRLVRGPSLGLRSDSFDESIALPRYRLDVSSGGTFVAKDRPEAADDDVKAVIEIDGGIGPQPARDLFTGNQLAGPLDQEAEQIDGLSADSHRVARQSSAAAGDRQARSLRTSSPRKKLQL